MLGIKRLVIAGFFVLVFIGFTYQFFGRSWSRALFINPIYKLEMDTKVIALTFDDGPSPARTPLLLDLLDKYQVKATFFMVGQNIEKYPDIARKVVDRGHMVGNHSYSHPRMIFKSPQFVREEIAKTNQLLGGIGSGDYVYFRPPYTNKFIVLPWVLRSMGMKLVTGTYDPGTQYKTPFPAQEVSRQVIDNAQPGSIVYLHDGSSNDPELFTEAIEHIIVELKQQGYQFVTLKEAE
jgi:peptidoglycan/xylan/chitin deacetylase (PgdA/CDA1 family)